MSISRKEVFEAIDSERSYQEKRWPKDELERDGHSLEEWFMFIEDYVIEAKHILTRENWKIANPKARDIMRKVAGLSVAALEEHGVSKREL